ncbi:MAG: PA14 domain-containing protein [bacterium]|nr:PA14 domain-containing protein [bacterium]
MQRLIVLAGAALLAACGGDSPAPATQPAPVTPAAGSGGAVPADGVVPDGAAGAGAVSSPNGGAAPVPVDLPTEQLAAELVVGRAGCVRCHPVDAALADRTAPVKGPPLAKAAEWFVRDGGAAWLQHHHGGEAAGDLAAWLRALAGDFELEPVATGKGMIARGEQLFHQLACGTCHAPDALAKLAGRTDHGHLTGFLQAPGERRPGTVHDFGFDAGEASALAAWILRMQVRAEETPVPGFGYECFELQIKNGDQPELAGVEVKKRGVAEFVDESVRSRETHFALRFRATLQVPADGDWKFTIGSDDGSWLYLDGKQVIDNGGLKPHKAKDATLTLKAGPHDLEVVFTQGGGGKSLELLWEGPGVAREPIPASRATTSTTALTPPEVMAMPAAEAVARGRAAAVAKRCSACHEIADPAVAELAAPALARPWSELEVGKPCPEAPAAVAVHPGAVASLGAPLSDPARLHMMLTADGCLACHPRAGRGGVPDAVGKHLEDTEDLGEEGRVPPDLSQVGARLRPKWITKVLTEGYKARPYVRARMPKVAPERAAEYARLFAAVDAPGVTDSEPEFSVAAVERGRELAGIKGRNCISCHTFAGAPSLGAQGMDLGAQFERLRPAWFRDWLLKAPVLRPGTRMPMFWPMARPEDVAEIDAIRSWLSLGAAAPVPEGLVPAAGSLVLLPSERPIFHGAFLKDVSARCIAVGSPARTHYAYDVENGRLVWLWRGGFLDATGTWHGRAGKLLEPHGDDWRVLQDFELTSGARQVHGHRVSADGYPAFVVRTAQVAYEDVSRARLAAGGSEIVRTLRCTKGPMQIEWASTDGVEIIVAGEAAPARTTVAEGAELEVIYRW